MVNRFCASGIDAVAQVAARIRAGEMDLAVAGGVESVSPGSSRHQRPCAPSDRPGDDRPDRLDPLGVAADLERQDYWTADQAGAAWTRTPSRTRFTKAARAWDAGGDHDASVILMTCSTGRCSTATS